MLVAQYFNKYFWNKSAIRKYYDAWKHNNNTLNNIQPYFSFLNILRR
jgi:hypothetical protein